MGGFLGQFASYLLIALQVAVIARVIVSWISLDAGSPFAPIVRIIYEITEPILGPIRRLLPSMGMFDLSPMIALVLIWVIQQFLVPRLYAL